MSDQEPGAAAGQTWMGSTATGFDSLPAGTQQMWQNEYFYLDGTVVLHQNQGWPEVNLIVEQMTWQQVDADINTKPDPAQGIVRYGLVRDTGDDRAPVPQYLTRSTPTNPTDVAQHSVVD